MTKCSQLKNKNLKNFASKLIFLSLFGCILWTMYRHVWSQHNIFDFLNRYQTRSISRKKNFLIKGLFSFSDHKPPKKEKFLKGKKPYLKYTSSFPHPKHLRRNTFSFSLLQDTPARLLFRTYSYIQTWHVHITGWGWIRICSCVILFLEINIHWLIYSFTPLIFCTLHSFTIYSNNHFFIFLNSVDLCTNFNYSVFTHFPHTLPVVLIYPLAF